MDKKLEKLKELFEKNETWWNMHPDEDGDKNPYPDKIQSTFFKWFIKNYVIEVSYATEEDGPVTVTVDREDDLWDATTHAYFDCGDVDACMELLEDWVKEYYEYYVLDEDEIVGDIVVRSVAK